MTPERIAEFRDAIANHPHFGIGGDALSKIIDALESAQQEIAARDAEIEALRSEMESTRKATTNEGGAA